ncbi:MAG: ComEC/Rec2 family competence protein [Prolixibacteraceae bacterium]
MSPGNVNVGKIPFLKYTLAFGIGILIGLKIQFQPFILLASIAFLILSVMISRKAASQTFSGNRFSTLIFIGLLIVFGLVYSSLYHALRFTSELPLNAKYTGVILEKSPSNHQRFRYLVKLSSITDSTQIIAVHEKIIVYNSDSLSNTKLQPGQSILFQSNLYPISNSNNPGEFNYRQYMFREGIRYQAYLKKGIKVLSGEHRTLKISALKIQSNLLNYYKKAGIKGDEFAVLSALTLGNKNYLSNELKSSFAASGAMHVLAVSGLHVGIIYLILKILLQPLNHFRKLKIVKVIFIFLFLWSYAFITGLSPSVLRSATMFSLILIGDNLNRKTNIYNTLAFSAFLLLLYDPGILFKIGFQLSYAAVTSIVFFQPRINALVKTKNQFIRWTWGLFSVSLAAQIGTFPFSLYYFHQFPVYFWLSNFIAIPAATILLYLAFLFFVTTPLPVLSHFFALLMNAVLKGLNASTLFIENLPAALIRNIWMDQFTFLLLVLLVILLAWALAVRKKMPALLGLVTLLIFTGYLSAKTIQRQRQSILLFYNTYSEPLLSIIDGENHYYFSTLDTISEKSERLLNNSSIFFHTGDAINMAHLTGEQTRILLHDRTIFYKNLVIRPLSKTMNLNLEENEIIWQTSDAKILVKKTSNLQFCTLKKGKFIQLKESESILTFNTQNNSSLLIFSVAN